MADKGWIKACLRGLVDRLGRGREAVRRCLRGRRRVADDDAGSFAGGCRGLEPRWIALPSAVALPLTLDHHLLAHTFEGFVSTLTSLFAQRISTRYNPSVASTMIRLSSLDSLSALRPCDAQLNAVTLSKHKRWRPFPLSVPLLACLGRLVPLTPSTGWILAALPGSKRISATLVTAATPRSTSIDGKAPTFSSRLVPDGTSQVVGRWCCQDGRSSLSCRTNYNLELRSCRSHPARR